MASMIIRRQATKLAKARVARGWTQEDVAFVCDVKQTTVSKWERGVMTPSEECQAILAEMYLVAVDDIFPRRQAPPEAIMRLRQLATSRLAAA